MKRCRLARLRTTAIGLLFFYIIPCTARPAAAVQADLPPPARELFKQALRAGRGKQYPLAETLYLRLLSEGFRYAFVYNNLGAVYQEEDQNLKAVIQFRKAIELEPGYVAPRILLGASLLALGKASESVQELKKAARLDPSNQIVRQQLAKAYEAEGDLPAAVDEYRSLAKIDPGNPEYAYRLGALYLKLASWSSKQILNIDPHAARIYEILAQHDRDQGQLDAAANALKQAARIDSHLPGVHLRLAQIYLEQGKKQEARSEVEKELALAPRSAAAKSLARQLQNAN
jgi:tetratricopeptide (TPR) repeat protein